MLLLCMFTTAAACEHASIVRLLMLYGADKTLTDTAGSSALDIADNADIAAILTSGWTVYCTVLGNIDELQQYSCS